MQHAQVEMLAATRSTPVTFGESGRTTAANGDVPTPSIDRSGLLRAALGGMIAVAGLAPLGAQLVRAQAVVGVPADLPRLARSAEPMPSAVMEWTNVLLQAVREMHPGPTIVARAIAILDTGMFDAWAAYDGRAVGMRLGDALRRPVGEWTRANKSEAISDAACADLFPTRLSLFTTLMTTLGYDPGAGSLDPSTPAAIGRTAAGAVLTYRHADGSNQRGDRAPGAYADYTGYQPVSDPLANPATRRINPNHWQPLHVSDGKGGMVTQHFTTPHWGLVAPFALSAGAQFRPKGPPVFPPDLFPSGEYYMQAVHILAYCARLTDEHKVIAEYWADGPSSELPPGHWCLFAQHASLRHGQGLDADVTMCFALGNALLDASIAAWDAKRAYDSIRPITAIEYLFGTAGVMAWTGPGLGTRAVKGADWKPYQPTTVVTPPFPEYVSGHSTFSAAAAEVLRRATGSDRCGWSYSQAAGTSRVEPGLTPRRDVHLHWATYSDAAAQAALSRRYGGIHFADGDLDGRTLGRQVGAQAWRQARAYIDGTAVVWN